METRIGRNRVVAIVLHVLLAEMLLCATSDIFADSFGSGANQFDIEFVAIGDPNNPDDTTGNPNPAGKVK